MEVPLVSHAQKQKRRVSMLCLAHSFSEDLICNIDHDKYLYMSSVFGEIFAFSTSFMVGNSLPALVDCGPHLYPLLVDGVHNNQPFKPSNNSSNIAKQAAMFITMISDVVQSTPGDTVTVAPSLHALQQCLRSGWRPESISEDVLNVSIALLDNKDLDTAAVAENLLVIGTQTSTSLANQILLALICSLRKVEDDKSVEVLRQVGANNQRLLSKCLTEFVRHSFRTLSAQAATAALQAANEPNRDHGLHAASVSLDKLGLGDKLEVWVSPDWVVGTIVKSNAVTGEFHVEHPATAPTVVGSNNISRSIVVSTLPNNSRRLRTLASGDDGRSAQAAQLSLPGAAVKSAQNSMTEDSKDSDQLINAAQVIALVYGSEDAMSDAATTEMRCHGSVTELGVKSTLKDIPMCENGHNCTVSKISEHSAGFMCAYCSKLYAADFDLPVFGSDPARFPLSRFALAQYKWCCEACHYDVCLSCFPHPEYPNNDGAHSEYAAFERAMGDVSLIHRGDAPGPTTGKHNAAKETAHSDPAGAGQGQGQRCTICLMGRNAQSYCRVRVAPTVTADEQSRVAHGSVIDVIDLPGSDFFQLLNGGGYVKKQPGKMCYWKRLPRDRYMMRGEEDAACFDRCEFAPLINLAATSSSAPVRGDDSGGSEHCQTNALAEVLALLVHHDVLLKARFKSFAGGNDQKTETTVPIAGLHSVDESITRILVAAVNLFRMTAEPLGEIVIASMDCFADEADDLFVSVNELSSSADLLAQKTTASTVGAFAALPTIGVSPQIPSVFTAKGLLRPDISPQERVSFFVLGAVFDVVVAVLTSLAERRITQLETAVGPVEVLALDIISVVSGSEFRTLLNQYFYRVMIAKAGIRAKLSAQIFLNNKQNHQLVESLEPALDAFQAIASIEAAYRSVILHSSIFASSPLFSACVADKLQDTVLVGGYATLANGIIELNHRVSATDTSHADDLKQALSAFVLLPKDRFAKSSRHMRKLLKELCQYASERNVSIVEGLWREVISDMVLEKCAASTTRTAARLDFQRLQQAEARSDSLVDYLIATLSETRYISRMDMAVTKQCCMSADLALVMAFRRLPKEKSLEITKALVVRVSSLIDSFKTHSTTRTWAQAIENVTDLIQVLFTQSSAEFQHFYELLLARRLLRNRYISLSTEWRVLAQLPAMSKSSLMIRDIEQSANAMHAFRSFLVDQIDFKDLTLPRDIAELALSGQNLQVNSLTGNVWPAIWIKPLSYATLTLPAGLDLIKRAYVQYFDAQNTTRFDAWRLNDKYKTLQISGAEDVSAHIQGVYTPSAEMSDGWPVYEMRDSASSSILEYSLRKCSWQIKKRSDRGKNAGWAYCTATPGTAPEHLDKPWQVWRKAEKAWVARPMVVSTVTSAQSKPRSLRRIVWCHAAGTMTVQATLNDGRHAHLMVTEAQAAVLMLFNSTVRSISSSLKLSFAQLQASLGLTSCELKGILSTFISAEAPVLQRSVPLGDPEAPSKRKQSHFVEDITTEDVYQLSNTFLRGDLGGLDENNPLVLSSIELDKHNSDEQLFDAGINSLYGWRNELIDASVVRVLKDAAAQKTGEFVNHNRQRFAALSIDSLCFRVRSALKDHTGVSAEDIMRRSERLVSIGVIDKVAGNPDTFRSVAYSYIADAEAPSSSVTGSPADLTKGNYVCDKVYGQDLYNHLRIVLGIRSLSSNATGVSRSLFAHKFISWIIGAQCDMMAPAAVGKDGTANFLDVFAGLLIEFLKAAEVQANTLQLQFCYGIHSACGSSSTAGAFKALQGLSSLQMLANIFASTIHNGLPNLHNYLALDRVYTEHLPAELVQDMLNYFRGLLKEPTVNYKQRAPPDSVNTSSTLHGNGKLCADAFPLPASPPLEIDTEPDTGRFTPATEEYTHASSNGPLPPPPTYEDAVNDDPGLSAQLKQQIHNMWNRSALVHKNALIHKFGFSETLLTSLNIIPAASSGENQRESKSSPVRSSTSKDQVRLSFKQLVAATFISASAEATDSLTDPDNQVSSSSFGYLLEEYFFKRLVDQLAELFGTDLNFAEEASTEEAAASTVTSTAPETAIVPEDDEVRIPCEFCTDSIRVSLFEAHTMACRAGRTFEPPTERSARAVHQSDGVRRSREGAARAEKKPRAKRPDSSSSIAVSLVEALLNAVAATACEIQKAVGDAEDEQSGHSSVGEMDESSQHPANKSFTSFLGRAFDVLDRDGDGFLSSKDFSVVEASYVDLLDNVEPTKLYGAPRIHQANAELKLSRFPARPAAWQPASKLPASTSLDTLTEEDLLALSTPVPLAKTSSLWRSVSHEKSLPSADASRSYSGLEEAERELTALVSRAMLIIDDSAAVSTSLLVHYKWDVKAMVEEYIENSRAVRLAAGLGPRNQPPFLRLDLFGATQGATQNSDHTAGPSDSPSSSPCVMDYTEPLLCGICQDTLVPAESFALTCRHWFCESCWQGYIHNAVNERSVAYCCPQPDCKFAVTSDMQNFFCDEEHSADARTVLVKSFVEDRRGKQVLATYCKNPRGCGGIVLMADDADYSEAVCSLCSTTFCAACDMPPHAPATCEMVAKWEEKGGYIETGRSEDVEARKLKHLTTKPCPKCGVRIEKSGGCPHMTCVQPSCKYQFCWECAGEYHTSTTCVRPKVKLDSNSVLAFDEFDRQCANHFLARKVALKGKAESHRLLEQTQRQEDAVILRIIAEGWSVLADAQSALAHSCIVMLNVKSAKLQFLFDCQKAQALSLQHKFEETWTSVETFSLAEAKAAIRDLRLRVRDYLLTVHTEIIVEKVRPARTKSKAVVTTPSRSRALSVSSPGGRQSVPGSTAKPGRSGSAADDISPKDLPLLQYLQQHTHAALAQSFQVEVANTVFGDAFGGSWRVYTPYLPTSTQVKGELPPQGLKFSPRKSITKDPRLVLNLPGDLGKEPSVRSPTATRPPRSALGVLPIMFSHQSSPGSMRAPFSADEYRELYVVSEVMERLMLQQRDGVLDEEITASELIAPAGRQLNGQNGQDGQEEEAPTSDVDLQENVKRPRK